MSEMTIQNHSNRVVKSGTLKINQVLLEGGGIFNIGTAT